jgi:uncharacterized protein (DUF2267 family)
MTEDDTHQAFEAMLERMLKANWLERFIFAEGKGWHLGWSEHGVEQADILKRISDTLGLADDHAARAVAFHVFAKGGATTGSAAFDCLPNFIAERYRECIEELEELHDLGVLSGDEVRILFHLVEEFGPDEETPSADG